MNKLTITIDDQGMVVFTIPDPKGALLELCFTPADAMELAKATATAAALAGAAYTAPLTQAGAFLMDPPEATH